MKLKARALWLAAMAATEFGNFLKAAHILDDIRRGGRPPIPSRHGHRSRKHAPNDGRWHMALHRDRH